MKLKLLLFAMMLSAGILNAQDTIRTLIITEARMERSDNSYVEISNVGTTPIQLSDFKFGRYSPWEGNAPFSSTTYIKLPAKILEPGKSFVIATVLDFTEEQHPLKPDFFDRRITKEEMWKIPDLKIHLPEQNGDDTDSITPGYQAMETWWGRDCWYLEQRLSENDSVVVDQVGGVFDNNGRNFDTGGYDVAGFIQATSKAILMRKFIVKNGNTNFAAARGVGADDSEWMPIPRLFSDWEPYRAVFWTLGNHGDYKLNENTLVSNKADVDFANSTITIAWGVRNQDDFMLAFEKKPGIAWHYDLSIAREDSAYMSAREGDKLTLYVCGSELQFKTFNIKVATPTADANIVIPKFGTEPNGYYSNWINSGGEGMFGVTVDAPGMDSITNGLFGIPYATKVDTLFKYLEKAPKAKWEIVWVDGVKRTDVKTGDILKVTAENGSVKEYYIKTNSYRPSHNAQLGSITWPDIPEYLKGIYGWLGDTIPNFSTLTYDYRVSIPADVDGIPALVASPDLLNSINSTVEVKRATSLQGSKEQQTITFTVTAEDGTTQRIYNVQLIKEKDDSKTQPFYAEPFLSEHVFADNYSNGFIEICNPGNKPLDLSNYMFIFDYSSSPAGAITNWSGVGNWGTRYRKYVPGYKWVNEASWAVSPGTLEQDLNVNSVVLPMDVFVGGHVSNTSMWNAAYPGPLSQTNVILNSPRNPWNESYTQWASAVHEWCGGNFYLFKILNDSIHAGLKAANDPNDFELIEVFGGGDGQNWNIGGFNQPGNQCMTFIRKPNFYKGKPNYKESFGTNQDDTEWIRYDQQYWQALNTPWPAWRHNATKDVGQHFMYEVTDFKSTVSSTVYKVSDGYSMEESIKGMKTGTTVANFLGGIIKANEKQTLKVKRAAVGELTMDAVLLMNDTLAVMSADSTNISKYLLNVTDEGLSSNAVITSTRYTVTIEIQPKSASETEEAGVGNVKGFDYGTALKTVLANIKVPAGATLTVINGDGAYVPLKMLNFDSTYVNVTVNDNIYLSVVAENGVTEIVYQLIPSTSESDAFVLSDVYDVAQRDVLIQYVPSGTTVKTLMSNLVASAGATMKIVNKLGQQRMDGVVADDDKVVVTSKDGSFTNSYYIAKLATQYITETTYLAYILSNVYAVDQVVYTVAGVSGAETVSAFLTKVTPNAGASVAVVDSKGVVKINGDINGGDKVMVTSADGKMMVYYTFGPLTSANNLEANNIELYPNPTNGEINVSGVKAGQRIQVYNSVGAAIREINVQSSIERISLRNQPAGMYMIVVSDNSKLIGRYKLMKQ